MLISVESGVYATQTGAGLRIDRICRGGSAVSDRSVVKQQRSLVIPAPVEHGRPDAPNRRKRWNQAWKQRLIVVMLVFSDVLSACLVWGAAYVVDGFWNLGELPEGAVAAITSSVAVWVVLRALLGLYPGYGLDSAERLRRHTYSVFGTLAVVAVFAIGLRVGTLIPGTLPRMPLAVAFLGLLFLAPIVQHFIKLGMKRARLWGKPVLILGHEDTGVSFRELLKQEWGLGYSPAALLDHLVPAEDPYQEVSYEEALTEAAYLGRELGVDTLIFATPYTRREQLASMVNMACESFRNILVVPNLNGVTNAAVVARDLAGTFAVELKYNLLNPWPKRFKRSLDLLGAVIGAVVISPLLFAIVVLIKLDSSGPAFFGHQRVGAADKHFLCWKFRTMHVNAERLLDEYLQDSPVLRAQWEQNQKLRDDPRVTRVGRFLRRTSLDELPQLWNVLRGEMSLTGPRPIVDAEIPKYGKDYELYRRIRPGMSGLWQVSGRNDISYEKRVAMDSYYVRSWSVWLDFVLLARTVTMVLCGRGAR
jgi:Undecaprenyl-phosphate galactose phosphotransferase WbaP